MGLAFPGHGAAALGTFGFKAGHAALVGFFVPAGQADTRASGTAAEAAASATASTAAASTTASGTATLAAALAAASAAALAASRSSLLGQYGHLRSSFLRPSFSKVTFISKSF